MGTTDLSDFPVPEVPEAFQAPNLRHVVLHGFPCLIQSRLHPSAASLVRLRLTSITRPPFFYFLPNDLLQLISCLTRLESLEIFVPSRGFDTHTPITAHITLHNLRFFSFQGIGAYLEAVVCRITTPRLENLHIKLGSFDQLPFSVPRLVEHLRFDAALIKFNDDGIHVGTYFLEANTFAFFVNARCWLHADEQASSVAQRLSPVLSAVEHLALRHEVHGQSSDNDVDRTEWRELLMSLSNVKTLLVEDGLIEELSRCLRLEEGELPLELLPKLQELTYFRSGDAGNPFVSFIDSRQNAGRPVTLRVDNQEQTPSLRSRIL